MIKSIQGLHGEFSGSTMRAIQGKCEDQEIYEAVGGESGRKAGGNYELRLRMIPGSFLIKFKADEGNNEFRVRRWRDLF